MEWQTLLRNKYISSKAITQVQEKPGDYYFWFGLMKIKSELLRWQTFQINNSSKTRFWNDSCLDNAPLVNNSHHCTMLLGENMLQSKKFSAL
jgi:hypothetical protein